MYARGDFSFIKRDSERAMLEDAFQVISETEGAWDYLVQKGVPDPNSGFMFSRDSFLMKLGEKVDRHGKIGHSGATYGCTMREMERIAKKGWDTYVSEKLAAATATAAVPFFDALRTNSVFHQQIQEVDRVCAQQSGTISYSQIREIMG